MSPKRKRGVVLLDDRTWQGLPEPILAQEKIRWPPTLPEKEPVGRTADLAAGDFCRRHQFVDIEFYVYMRDSTIGR